MRARGWKAGEISGEYRGRALREEGEETGVWGHGVSGSGRSRVLRSQAPTGGPGGAVRVALAGERGGRRWAAARSRAGLKRSRPGGARASWAEVGPREGRGRPGPRWAGPGLLTVLGLVCSLFYF